MAPRYYSGTIETVRLRVIYISSCLAAIEGRFPSIKSTIEFTAPMKNAHMVFYRCFLLRFSDISDTPALTIFLAVVLVGMLFFIAVHPRIQC